MPKRHWNKWPKDTFRELNSISGAVGLSGLVLGSAGAVASAPLILGVGCAVFGVAIVYSGVRAYPKRLGNPENLVGKKIESISELDHLSEKIIRIGIIGSSKTGKSTLVEKLKREINDPNPTSGVYAVIMKSGGAAPKIFALLDGAGEHYQQQFAVAAESDGLFIIFDHNESRDDASVKLSRTAHHDEFINQIVPFLRSRKSKISRIYIYLNKHDNWSRSTKAPDFLEWGERTKIMFSGITEIENIFVRAHSNWRADDINMFWNEVEEIRK